jgi:hypothetical protein
MNTSATLRPDVAKSDAYMDLEPKIRDLTHMAELARFHAIEAFGSIPPNETEEGKRERSIALFAVAHVEEMVRDLEKAYDAGWRRRAPPASADEQSRTVS